MSTKNHYSASNFDEPDVTSPEYLKQKKKEQEEEMKKKLEEEFYNQLEESDTLVDYFGIIGLDQQRIAQMYHEGLSKEQIAEELKQMKPSLICKFPPKDKKGMEIESSITDLHNVRIIKHSSVPTFYSFQYFDYND